MQNASHLRAHPQKHSSIARPISGQGPEYWHYSHRRAGYRKTKPTVTFFYSFFKKELCEGPFLVSVVVQNRNHIVTIELKEVSAIINWERVINIMTKTLKRLSENELTFEDGTNEAADKSAPLKSVGRYWQRRYTCRGSLATFMLCWYPVIYIHNTSFFSSFM